MVYGFGAMNNDDPHILLAEEMMRVSENAIIGGWAVDFFPWRASLLISAMSCQSDLRQQK